MEKDNITKAYEEITEKYEAEGFVSEEMIYYVTNKYDLSMEQIDVLGSKMNAEGIDNYCRKADEDKMSEYMSDERYKRTLCAKIAVISLQKSYLDSGFGFVEYVADRFGLKKTSINDYKRVGLRFMERDSANMPDVSGTTIFMEKYGFQKDFSVTQLFLMLPLQNEEIRVVIEEHGLTPDISVNDLKKIISKVHIKKKSSGDCQNQLQHAIKAFDKLPEEYKLAVLEREIKRRYGLTLENLKKLN